MSKEYDAEWFKMSDKKPPRGGDYWTVSDNGCMDCQEYHPSWFDGNGGFDCNDVVLWAYHMEPKSPSDASVQEAGLALL